MSVHLWRYCLQWWTCCAKIQAGICHFSVKSKHIIIAFQQISPDGKVYFVGCAGYQRGDDINGHWFTGIPLAVDKKMLLKVMQNNSTFKHALQDVAVAQGCMNMHSC